MQEMAGKTLVDLLQASVNRAPQAVAVVYNDRQLSYAELWRDVIRLSTFFQRQGLARGERVALLMDNCPEFIAAYYATLRAGAAVVALNAAAKAQELLNWLRHSGARWLIVDAEHSELAAVLRESGDELSVIVVQGEADALPAATNIFSWATLSVNECDGGAVDLDPEDLAAIIYTSGTTGAPKGVMLSHRNLYSNVTAIVSYLELGAEDRVLNVLPFYYSYGNSVLHTHLAVGASIVLEKGMLYPHRIVERMSEQRVTGFSGVPSTYALLLSRVRLENYDLSSLRYLTQAGGAMLPEQIQRMVEMLPWVRFFVMYGQTEATARICYLPPERLMEKLGSVGIPIPGVKVDLRDARGKPVEVGESGEIYVQGENLMMGYWRNPDATQQVLIQGWLKTGDLACYDEEGYLYIQGRNSDIIKTGAYRISPQEIEEIIVELPAVEEVAVIGVPDTLLGEVVKAVIVICPAASLDKQAVQRHCRDRLPQYKIPKAIEFVAEIPKTASGKFKRHVLAKAHHEERDRND